MVLLKLFFLFLIVVASLPVKSISCDYFEGVNEKNIKSKFEYLNFIEFEGYVGEVDFSWHHEPVKLYKCYGGRLRYDCFYYIDEENERNTYFEASSDNTRFLFKYKKDWFAVKGRRVPKSVYKLSQTGHEKVCDIRLPLVGFAQVAEGGEFCPLERIKYSEYLRKIKSYSPYSNYTNGSRINIKGSDGEKVYRNNSSNEINIDYNNDGLVETIRYNRIIDKKCVYRYYSDSGRLISDDIVLNQSQEIEGSALPYCDNEIIEHRNSFIEEGGEYLFVKHQGSEQGVYRLTETAPIKVCDIIYY